MIHLKYTLGAIAAIPLLPFMYFQGKKIKNSIPKLPEASAPEGTAGLEHTSDFQLITIGESTIAGVGVKTHREGFSGTLAKSLAEKLQKKISWKVYARSGYSAKLVHERLVPKITEWHVDLIVIGLGGNDSFALNSPAKWAKNIIQLLDSLRLTYPETTIVFINIPPIKSFPAFTGLIKLVVGNLSEILGDHLQNVIKKYPNVYFNNEKITLDSWISKFNLKNNTQDFFSDGVHPSLLTYQTWASDMANFIIKNVFKK